MKIGRIDVSLEHRSVSADGQLIRLGSRAFDILELLIDARGKLVTRDTIRRTVWPDTIVEENNIQVHVSSLRKAFGDDRGLIETVPGRGYRLNGVEPPFADHHTRCANSLERQTRLFGRLTCIDRVIAASHRSPLVTLTGPGGIGKTRLAFEAAKTLATSAGGSTLVISFASLVDGCFLQDVVAASLGVKRLDKDCLNSRVSAIPGDHGLVIVLDNCEHLIDAAAAVCEQLIEACPNARLIATSREPLCITRESVYIVPALDCPNSGDTCDQLLASPAVQMFLTHAGVQCSGSVLQTARLALVATICRKLGGVPLALEIAAARTRSVGIECIASELGDRFQVLSGTLRTAVPRQRSLTATLDWSYKLLSTTEQATLRRIGVFSSHFSPDAAQEVADGFPLTAATVKEALAGLVSKSLLTLTWGAPPHAYSLPETTRAYACSKLADAEETGGAFTRHASFLTRHFESQIQRWQVVSSDGWLEELRLEVDNVRSTLDWCLSKGGDLTSGVKLAATVLPYFFDLSLIDECRRRTSLILRRMNEANLRDPSSRMRLLAAFAASRAYTLGPSGETRSAWSEVLTLAVKSGCREFEAHALKGLWESSQFGGEGRRALYFARRLLSLSDQQGNWPQRLLAERMVGVALHFHGDQQEARQHLERMLTFYDHSQHQWKTFGCRVDHGVAMQATLARIYWLQGDTNQARLIAERALHSAQISGHALTIGYVLVEALLPLQIFLCDAHAARESLISLRLISQRFASTLWENYACCCDLYIRSLTDESRELIALYRSALDEMAAAGLGSHACMFQGKLASMLRSCGMLAEALGSITATLQQANSVCNFWFVGELKRIEGEIQLELGRPDLAFASFESALALTRQQGAHGLEARILSSLAHAKASAGCMESTQVVVAHARDPLASSGVNAKNEAVAMPGLLRNTYLCVGAPSG
jgi:predicted ATPase